jgi:6-phosphogluconolactonase/glucosamine-6-phosphate isomerase/deaminase
VMDELPDHLTKQLTIIPIDERYGRTGHPNSNVQQLYDAGFKPKQATFFAPLNNSSLEKTVKRYEQAVQAAYSKADLVIAQIGLGTDGHIAGILPESPALYEDTLVTAYEGPDYTRMTLTLAALRRISQAYLFVYGRDKRAALDRLCDGDIRISFQPAQVLRELKEVYIYNDQLEDRNA